MCGITGIFNYRSNEPVDAGILSRMTSRLSHRGPDGDGFHLDGTIGLGHRRLAIIDLEGGHQPLSNERGDVWVSFNGEIYNHAELRRDLLAKGHIFRTKCDTEVLVHLYEEHGANFVNELNGMFAIALWDARRRQLLLVRDRLGIKPLYYFDSGTWLAFASELSGLLSHPLVPRQLDKRAVHEYLNYEYVAAPGTLLRGVNKLPAANMLTIRTGVRSTSTTYWRYRQDELVISESQAIERFRELFARSIKRRMISDVPLGAFLSGGLDSSSIVAEMVKSCGAVIKTFSIGFEDQSYDEASYARAVAQRFGCDHTELILQPDPSLWIDQALDNENEPLGDFSLIPTAQVCALARRDVTVCLSGDGADELLAGYERHLASRLEHHTQHWLPFSWRQRLFRRFARLMPMTPRKKGATDLLRRFLEGAGKCEHGRQMRWQTYFEDRHIRVLAPAAWDELRDFDPYQAINDIARSMRRKPLDQELAIEATRYLPDNILAKVDRASMAVSLEARTPFLDHELVEFLVALPASMKFRRWRGKYLLRQAMRQELPAAICTRRKQGFSMPIKRWLRSQLFERVEQTFSASAADLDGILQPAAMRELLREHQLGLRDHSHILWSLFTLTNWWSRLQGDPSQRLPQPLAT